MRSAAEHWTLVERFVPDPDALAFLRTLNTAVNVWDDLIDRDAPCGEDRIHAGFLAAMVEIPRNPFYQRHQQELQPCIEAAICDWIASIDMQRDPNPEMRGRAHVLRFSGLAVWLMCARICGGMQAGIDAALALRRAIPNETLPDFLREIQPCSTPSAG